MITTDEMFSLRVKGEVQKRSERIALCYYGSRDEMIVLTKKNQEAELEVSRFLLGVTKIPKATLRYTHFDTFAGDNSSKERVLEIPSIKNHPNQRDTVRQSQ